MSSSLLLFSTPFAFGQISFTGVRDLPGGDNIISAHGVSGDGSSLVGYADLTTSSNEAYLWSQSGVIQGLGTLPTSSSYSYAQGVSVNGSFVVGRSSSVSRTEAFLWTQDGSSSMQGLGFLDGKTSSSASGVSDDGSVVVGSSGPADAEAFLWTQSGMQGLGFLDGDASSSASGVSGDGSTVVGTSSSADGSQAFLWTQSGGMEGLGFLDGNTSSYASGVSGDGSVVVGSSGREAFLWTPNLGITSLRDYLIGEGVSGLDDWSLSGASEISFDGTAIIGNGYNSTTASREYFFVNGLNLSAVPEPATVFGLGVGTIAFLLATRNRRKPSGFGRQGVRFHKELDRRR